MLSLQSLLKLISVLTIVSALTGCLLTDAFKTELLENHKKQSELSEIEQEKAALSDEKSQLNKKIEELERRYTLKEIEDNIEDFKALRPGITRLIELESDLAFITEFLRNKEKPVTFAANQPRGEQMGSLPELSDIVEQQQNQNFLSKNETNSEESERFNELSTLDNSMLDSNLPPVDTFQNAGAQVEVMAVAPINASISDRSVSNESTGSIASIDSKFSSLSNTESPTFVSSQENTMDAKFSSGDSFNRNANVQFDTTGSNLKPINLKGATLRPTPSNNLKEAMANNTERANTKQLSNCPSVNSNGRYSVHLASYSNKKTAKEGWQNLENKYAAVLCALTPKLASVEVKGRPYLSLRVGPIDNKAMAQEICKAIQEKGDYCASAPYDGIAL